MSQYSDPDNTHNVQYRAKSMSHNGLHQFSASELNNCELAKTHNVLNARVIGPTGGTTLALGPIQRATTLIGPQARSKKYINPINPTIIFAYN